MTREEHGSDQIERDVARHFAYVPDARGTVRALGIDKYPGEMAIVRELVQNADDAFDRKNKIFPTYVRFTLKDDELVMEHDGKPFSKPPRHLLQKDELADEEDEELKTYDFVRISRIGVGKTDEEMTGKFGAGFTSVFHITDNPRIESNGWDFEIHIGKEPACRPIALSRLTRIRLPYRLVQTEISTDIGAEVFDREKRKHFQEQILAESYRIIFFLKHVARIEVFEDDAPLYTVERIERRKKTRIRRISCKDVTISIQNLEDEDWKDSKEKWWIYSLENIPVPPRFAELGLRLKQKVSIAICKGKPELGERLKVGNHSCFTFPIRATRFRFKYNASRFFTTTDRSEFITKEGLKNAWNIWQVENVVSLLTRVIADFVLSGKKADSVYHILPQRHEYNHKYDKYLIDGFRERVQQENLRILFTTQGKWVGPKDTYIGDERLEKILPRNEYRYFVEPKFTRNYRGVLEYYGAIPVSHKDLIGYLEKNQETEGFKRRFNKTLRREKIDRLRLMLEYLDSSDLDSEDVERLKGIDFILTEHGTLRSANYAVYFRSDEDMPLISPDDIVHHSVYTSKSSRAFLRNRLRIKNMDLHDLITDSFLLRLDDYNDKQIFAFVLYLARCASQVMRNKETIEQLRGKASELLWVEINDPEDPDIYFADGGLKQIFDNGLKYLSQEYAEKLSGQTADWKDLFKAIGVKEIPPPGRMIGLADDISDQGFSNESAVRAERLFRFISKNLRKLDEDEKQELKQLNYRRWIPTTNKDLEYPDDTYVDGRISHLVGSEPSFALFSVKRNDPLAQLLEMPTEALVKDVVEFLVGHRAENNGQTDRKVSYRIYRYLNDKVEAIDEKLADRLRENRTIWFGGRLWYPHDVFLRNHRREFGPNGKIRAYIRQLKDLKDLCSLLEIREYPKEPDDYVDFLLDISEQAEEIEVPRWRGYIENACDRLAYGAYPPSEERKAALSRNRIIIVDSYLMRPTECHLIRETDRIYKDRIERSGIVDVPLVRENDPQKERFYLSIGMKEISESILQKRADENRSETCPEWKERLGGLIPWINGYGYHALGDEGLLDLDVLEMTGVQKVSGLSVSYGIDHNGERIMGNPIDDSCCLDIDRHGQNVLYLDTSFDEENNEHVLLLSNLLTTLIGPDSNVKRVDRIMLMSQYFRHGEISGINPYYPRRPERPARDVEAEEEPTEEMEEEYPVEGEEVGEAPPKEEEEREEEPRSTPIAGTSEEDDGLTVPEELKGTRTRRRRRTSAPPHRGGSAPTPHAINYEEERNWVRKQAQDFCQVCILFCEDCEVKDVEGQCPCEIRKNAERALQHHHLEPFKKDPRRDVRGNLAVVCSYHHQQLLGTDLKSGYLNDKVNIKERQDDFILTLYPKDKDKYELRLRFTKEHFHEFQNYVERENT